jgi:hypothetical protein
MPDLTPKQIESIRSIIANLDGLQIEIDAAVKRKANEPITPFQLKIINEILAKANLLLKKEKPFADFTEFDVDTIPTAADVSMVIRQYVEKFETLRCENIEKLYNGSWVWTDAHNIVTVPPRGKK